MLVCRPWSIGLWASPEGRDHREGIGQLEHQAMPSVRVEVTHDGWLCTFMYYITAAGNSVSWQLGSSCQCNRYGKKKRQAVHHVQNPTCRITLLLLARRAAVLDQPSSLRPHWSGLTIYVRIARKPKITWQRKSRDMLIRDTSSRYHCSCTVKWMRWHSMYSLSVGDDF